MAVSAQTVQAPDTNVITIVNEAPRMARSLISSAGCLRSEEHTSELQSHSDLVCRLLLEKKKELHETHQTAVVALGEHVLRRLLLKDAEDLRLQGGFRVGRGEQLAERVDAVGEEADTHLPHSTSGEKTHLR